ncbi:Alpha/Beta hydrolase protein [Mycena epipterygia]|nr:Alpha/Beta hydrolase protein [Mycena epipterygia]
MPIVSIPAKDIHFFFTDTGAPSGVENYTTLIFVHGHTFHANVFQHLLPLAAARSVRIVCINRREVYASGSEQERAALMSEAGVNLALCVDGIIQQCALPSGGHVALVGWSLGNTFTLAAISSIMSVPPQTRDRLQSFVKTIIMWDPPSHALGIASPPNAYVPLYDLTLEPAARGPAFGKWVASYFVHDMPITNLITLADFSVELPFASVVSAIVNKALFDPEVRAAWGNTKVAYMYARATTWNILFAAWKIEEGAQKAEASIIFHPIEGANHFLMWEGPGKAMGELIGCTKA